MFIKSRINAAISCFPLGKMEKPKGTTSVGLHCVFTGQHSIDSATHQGPWGRLSPRITVNVAQHRDYKLIEDIEILCVISFNFIHL